MATFQQLAAQDWAGFIGPRGLSQPPFSWIEMGGAALGWWLNRRRAKLTRLAGAFLGAVFLVWLYKAHVYANYDLTTRASSATLRADYLLRFWRLLADQFTVGAPEERLSNFLGYNAVGLGSLALYTLTRWRDGDRVTLRRAAKRERRGLRRWRRAMRAYERLRLIPVSPVGIVKTVENWREREVVRVHEPDPLPPPRPVPAVPDHVRRAYGEPTVRRTAEASDGLALPGVAAAVAAAGELLERQQAAQPGEALPLVPLEPASSLPITTKLVVPAGHVLVQLGGNYMIVPLNALPPVLRLDAKRLRFRKVRGFFGALAWCINFVLNTLRTALWLIRAAITLALPLTLLFLYFYGGRILSWGEYEIEQWVRYLLHKIAPSLF